MTDIDIKVARIEEKLSIIEKIVEKMDSTISELEKSFFITEVSKENINQIAKELGRISKQQNAFKAFTAGIGFAFSVFGGIMASFIKKIFD